MKYEEKRIYDIPCISFMKGARFNLYVGPELSWFQRRKLRKVQSRYEVVYLPELFKKVSAGQLCYNFPGLKMPDVFSAEAVYEKIREAAGGAMKPDCRYFVRYDGVSFIYSGAATGSFDLALSYLADKGADFQSDMLMVDPLPCASMEEDVRFSATPGEENELPLDKIFFRMAVRPALERETSDTEFEQTMMKAAEDVKDAINALLMTGFPVEIIQSWLDEKVQLSRLRITKHYKILLVDYDMEIKMGPLPKTVFLFYLRHPEGVRFSCLQDHVDELRRIYERVSVNDDPRKMEESINALIDPFNNSICEKCAAIKKSFILKVKDSIAKNYYVTGMQGWDKCISLDRALVEWECDL